MSEYWWLAIGAGGGLVIGGLYFAGLWWTVQRVTESARPALLVVGSMLVRNVIAVAGLYLVSGRTWQGLVGGLVGMLIAREVVLRKVKGALDREGADGSA